MPLALSAVTMNSRDPVRTAAFWAAALAGVAVDGGNGFVHVRSHDLLLIVQPAPDRDPTTVTDVHLDLRADDRAAEVTRLCALGAVLVEHRSDSHGTWSVLLDPDGRELCVG